MTMMKNITKPCKFLLILFIAMLTITGAVGNSYDMHKSSGENVKESLCKLISSVSEVICAFRNGHSLGDEGPYIPPMYRKCQQATHANGLTEFFGALQQMQVDEVRMHGEKMSASNVKLARLIRHLEYDLRDVTETKLRRFITEYIGPVKVPYSLGSLPSNASVGASGKILIRHYYKLSMLRSCISHILHMDRWMHLMMGNSTKDVLCQEISTVTQC